MLKYGIIGILALGTSAAVAGALFARRPIMADGWGDDIDWYAHALRG